VILRLLEKRELEEMQHDASQSQQGAAHAMAYHVASKIADANNQALATQPQVAAVAGNSGPLPSPNTPPSGCPSSAWPSNDPTNLQGTGYLDVLNQYLLYLANHPNDIGAKMSFLSYLTTLAQHGVLGSSQVQSILSQSGIMNDLPAMVQQVTVYALFYGFNGVNGQAGVTSFLNSVIGVLSPLAQGNPQIATMLQLFQAQLGMVPAMLQTYGFTNGGTGSVQVGNVIYDFNNPQDQEYIYVYISNLSPGGTPDPFYGNFNVNAAERSYRMTVINQLLAEYKDPSIVLCLFLMLVNDQQTQAQMGGLADTSNTMSNMTNNYATPLLVLAQQFGSFSTANGNAQAQQFIDLFFNATNMVNMQGQLSSLAGTWNTNVYNMMMNQNVTFIPSWELGSNGQPLPGAQPITTTLGNVMTGGTYQGHTLTLTDATQAFNSLQTMPNGSGGSTTNPALQGILNSLQQAGGLLTSTTQQLVTKVGTLSQIDSQYLKFGSTITSPTGGGFVQMVNQFVQNQRSN
jgi:hypothetical protein